MIPAYCRTSTARQKKQCTIEAQKESILKCFVHRGIDPSQIAWYLDGGKSGKLPLENRPEGRRLMEDMRTGKFDQKFVLNRVFNGAAVRQDSREFADYLNAFIAKQIESGELPKLYKQWIGKDMVANLPATGEGDAPLPVDITK